MKQIIEIKPPRKRAGFTLIELLTVISIIGILASLLLPAIVKAKTSAKVAITKTELNNIASAITAYYSAYSRYPCSTAAADSVAANPNACPDFTYGTVNAQGGVLTNKKNQPLPQIRNVGNAGYQAWNSEVIAILTDNTNAIINGVAINANHAKNPNQTSFLNAKMTTDPHGAGIGPDGVFRDIFGNPYIITLDLNYDEKCRDAFYRLETVSSASPASIQGVNGLTRPGTGIVNAFEFRGSVMVWSFGPDTQANAQIRADQGVNRDNILNWKQ